MMTSEPRAPSLVGAMPKGSFCPGRAGGECGQHGRRLVLGHLLVGGARAGEHPGSSENQRGLVGPSDGEVDGDADLLVVVGGLGCAGEDQPLVAGDARFGGAAGRVVGFLDGASTSRSGMPMKRPTWVESMMMRLSSLPTGNLASGRTSQEASAQVDRSAWSIPAKSLPITG